jgi:hypothetical protein
VVREEQNLRRLANLRKKLKGGRTAVIVKMHKQIVGDERQWLARFAVVEKLRIRSLQFGQALNSPPQLIIDLVDSPNVVLSDRSQLRPERLCYSVG